MTTLSLEYITPHNYTFPDDIWVNVVHNLTEDDYPLVVTIMSLSKSIRINIDLYLSRITRIVDNKGMRSILPNGVPHGPLQIIGKHWRRSSKGSSTETGNVWWGLRTGIYNTVLAEENTYGAISVMYHYDSTEGLFVSYSNDLTINTCPKLSITWFSNHVPLIHLVCDYASSQTQGVRFVISHIKKWNLRNIRYETTKVQAISRESVSDVWIAEFEYLTWLHIKNISPHFNLSITVDDSLGIEEPDAAWIKRLVIEGCYMIMAADPLREMCPPGSGLGDVDNIGWLFELEK